MFMREVKEERVLGGEKIALKNKGRGTKQIKLKKNEIEEYRNILSQIKLF